MTVLDYPDVEYLNPASTGVQVTGESWHIIPATNEKKRADLPEIRLLTCAPAGYEPFVQPYASYICELLHGQMTHLSVPEKGKIMTLKRVVRQNDLVIFGEPEPAFVQKVINGYARHRAVHQWPTSILVTQRPHWPIRRLLLVLRLEITDRAAIDWTIRLALASGAEVIILPLVPLPPAMYASGQSVLESLLSSQTAAGQKLRQLAQRLCAERVPGALRLRQGEPVWQMHTEIEAGNYDLVLIGAEPYPRWQRWFLGELVVPLLDLTALPILVAKSAAGFGEGVPADE